MHAIDRELIEWAQRRGRVPTHREAVEIIGTRRSKHGNASRTIRTVFNLRRRRPTEAAVEIPFPVPRDMQA